MKKTSRAGVSDTRAGLQPAGLFSSAGIFKKGFQDFHPLDESPYLLFDAQTSMLGNLENPTLDLDASKTETLDVITATRSGIATFTSADGQIVTADPNTVRVDYVQGEELTPTKFQRIPNTDFSSGWSAEGGTLTENQTHAPDGTTPVYEFTENTSTSRHRLFDSGIPLVVGQTYTVSVYVKKVSSGRFFLINSGSLNGIKGFLNLDTGVATLTNGTGTIAVTNEGSGWYRLSVTAEATSTSGFVYMQLQNAQTDVNYTGTGASMLIWGPQLEEGTTATDFVENTTGSPKFTGISATYGPRVAMMLIEPSATNLVPYSEDFSNSQWLKNDVAVSAAPVVAPDGTMTATHVSVTGSNPHLVYLNIVQANTHTVSIWARTVSGAGTCYFNANSTGELVTVTDQWQRFEVPANNIHMYAVDFRGSATLDEIYIWGAQAELGSVATSYIPTSGGYVTRQADDLVISGSNFTDFFNSGGDGTFYAEFTVRDNNAAWYVINGHDLSRRYMYSNDTQTSFRSYDGVAPTVDFGFPVNNTLHRVALSFNSSEKRGSLNGSAESFNTHTGTFSTTTLLHIGKSSSGAAQLNGHIKRLIYWPTHSSNL